MAISRLIEPDRIVGVLRDVSQDNMEFRADLVLPYRADYHREPVHGRFVLVELTDESEALLGRITGLRAEGGLTSDEGEDYLLRAIGSNLPIPDDIRERYLKYRVNVRVLGLLRCRPEGRVIFVPSHRRLPHVGSRVALPSDPVLRFVAGHDRAGASLGHLALGEFVWAQGDAAFRPEPWMQILGPAIEPKFEVERLVARRTVVFARSGFGKSNLLKLLFAELYRGDPTVQKRTGRAPVGTVIFDRDGEYFWPDARGRPGLCDVDHLADKLVVFTSRRPPSPFYGSFVAGPVKVDIRRFPPETVVGIALGPERQEQQNVRKLKGLPWDKWRELVDLVYQDRHSADLGRIKGLLGLEQQQEVEALAARANMTYIVQMLHDPESRLQDMLFGALKAGKLCVVDLSLLSGEAALALSAILLRQIFNHNVEQFTLAEAESLAVIAVLEEAQSVLGQGAAATSPFVAWVKEGRKYDLGAVLVTQQPGSLDPELLSQVDNWFVFHLLSADDLRTLKRHNANFGEDILSSLLNEPIPGHCVFWSGVRPEEAYPIPTRVRLFEAAYRPLDPEYKRGAVEVYAGKLRARHEPEATDGSRPGDYLTLAREGVLRKVPADPEFRQWVAKGYFPWGMLNTVIRRHLPPALADNGDLAYQLSRDVLNHCFGETGRGWRTEQRPGRSGGSTTYVVLLPDGLVRFQELYGDAG